MKGLSVSCASKAWPPDPKTRLRGFRTPRDTLFNCRGGEKALKKPATTTRSAAATRGRKGPGHLRQHRSPPGCCAPLSGLWEAGQNRRPVAAPGQTIHQNLSLCWKRSYTCWGGPRTRISSSFLNLKPGYWVYSFCLKYTFVRMFLLVQIYIIYP